MKKEPWLTDPLGHLIGPERVEEFLAQLYEREALVVAHDEPDRFKGLITIDDVDRIVTSTDLKEGQLDMADANSRRLSRTDYIDDAGYVDRGAVADFHRGGATIILQQAHQIEPSLGRFCRALEFVFSSHVQTNLYLTPPSAQGFKTHYDNHDVFVIQVHGEKAWRLYDKPVDTPFRGEGFQSSVHKAGELRQEFVLKSGDCAYVPRGMMHDAQTSGSEPSLHVTVGLITKTWADLMLEAVAEVALRTPELRRSLPPGFANPGFDREPSRAYLRKLADVVAREAQLDPALDLLGDSFIRSRAGDNRYAVRDAAKGVRADEKFRARPLSPYRIAEDADTLVVIGPGGELKFAPDVRVALERALNGKTFSPSDLEGANDALGMTARLLAYGLIVRV